MCALCVFNTLEATGSRRPRGARRPASIQLHNETCRTRASRSTAGVASVGKDLLPVAQNVDGGKSSVTSQFLASIAAPIPSPASFLNHKSRRQSHERRVVLRQMLSSRPPQLYEALVLLQISKQLISFDIEQMSRRVMENTIITLKQVIWIVLCGLAG